VIKNNTSPTGRKKIWWTLVD